MSTQYRCRTKEEKYNMIWRSLPLNWLLIGAFGVLLQLCALIYSFVCFWEFVYHLFWNPWCWECLLVLISIPALALASIKVSLDTYRRFSRLFLMLDPSKGCWGHSYALTYLSALVFHSAFLPVYIVCYFSVQHLFLSEPGANSTWIWLYRYSFNLAFWLGWCTVALIICFVPSFGFYWAGIGSVNRQLWVNEKSSNINERSENVEVLDGLQFLSWLLHIFHVLYCGFWFVVFLYHDFVKTSYDDFDPEGTTPVNFLLFCISCILMTMGLYIDTYSTEWFLGVNPTEVDFELECVANALGILTEHCLYMPIYVVCYYYAKHFLLLGLGGKAPMIQLFQLVLNFGFWLGVSTMALICGIILSFGYLFANASFRSIYPRFARARNDSVVDTSDLDIQEPLLLSGEVMPTSADSVV